MSFDAQTSNAVLLVRPSAFAFNAETARTNAFAAAGGGEAAAAAAREFDRLAERLANAGLETVTLDDDAGLPDAIFPNNWVSFHADGTIVTYPMAAPSRRLERRVEPLRQALGAAGFEVRRHVDLSPREAQGRFLEGTGSLVLDRPRRRAFASLGPRTDAEVLAEFADQLGYSAFPFAALDRKGVPIYHSNVALSLGRRFAVLGAQAVPDEQRAGLRELLAEQRMLIEVDYEQLESFACNIIELEAADGSPLIALSAAARRSFQPGQLRRLEQFGSLVEADIPTIERVGGGSVRCMIADIHLPLADRGP